MRKLRVALAQINPTVGDLAGNTRLIKSWIKQARKAGADLVAFPELAVTGYPPEDLLLKPRFIADNRQAMTELARECAGIVAVVGYVEQGSAFKHPVLASSVICADQRELYNAAAILADRRCVATYCKQLLPNYGVFDEGRYFHPGRTLPLITIRGVTLGVNICEDIWFPEGPTRVQAMAGAEVIVNINASPFHIGKSRSREQMLATRARENGVIVTYTNTVGGQDELIFDGNSVIVDQNGEVIARAKAFEEDLIVADLNVEGIVRGRVAPGLNKRLTRRVSETIERVKVKSAAPVRTRVQVIPRVELVLSELEEVYKGLVLGVRDYVNKNGFKKAVIGLSGGVDSALTVVIAADALGAANVLGIFMPSAYTSQDSAEDVAELSRCLSIECRTIAITPVVDVYGRSLAPTFEGRATDTTEENLQARIRGNILMAVSNKFGHLVLTTGNKSEMSVGYATLYGDMAGGFAVLKDVPKTMVYELANLRNRQGAMAVIPKRVLDRPPTAELKPNQKDEDSLPPYPILDPILRAYVEEDRSIEEIIALGFARDTVAHVVGLVDRSEYKRRQAPVGIKITHRGLGKDRRMPITNGYQSS
ncbi:MAG TPA: NAD+ synthase [Nitrospira sp.]|nr:NAD+ synthase [Nitrospira sp.]